MNIRRKKRATQEDHVRSLLRHVRPGDVHRDAQVRLGENQQKSKDKKGSRVSSPSSAPASRSRHLPSYTKIMSQADDIEPKDCLTRRRCAREPEHASLQMTSILCIASTNPASSPISSLCFGDVRANTISCFEKTSRATQNETKVSIASQQSPKQKNK